MPEMKISAFVLTGLALGIAAGIATMLAALGSRWGWWYFRKGFAALRWAAYAALLGAFLSGIGLAGSLIKELYDGIAFGIVGFLINLVVAGNLWNLKKAVSRMPPIHDITTDTENPPQFIAVLPLRNEATNPVEYGGPAIAAHQRRAYPDIAPLVMRQQPLAVFEKAMDVVHMLGWKLVDANAEEGRIEAIDTTFWFGFKDDVVIRVTRKDSGSRVDVRSLSRVGKTDLGVNARRIRKFFKLLHSM